MSNPTEKKFIPCDIETIITAEITLTERNIGLSSDFPFEKYKDHIKYKIAEVFSDERLKDDDIKVKVFLHEKSEISSETE